MARLTSRIPWGIPFHIAMLFVIAWWIEDCCIYYIDWGQTRVVQYGGVILAASHIGDFLRFFSQFAADAGHAAARIFRIACTVIQTLFDALPPTWRTRVPLRFVAWCGTTIIATFGADPASEFWHGCEWVAGKLLKALIALNGGFWIHNSMRRLTRGLGTVITYPVRFYSERAEEEQVAAAEPPAAHPDEVAPPKSRGDGRTRRREYVQFMQGHIERIGIILAGGGAKGAYQAGALKAIHEFLSDYNALHKVKMIAGTSIGAWNAMFWLGGMIDTTDRKQPSLENWWKNLD
jgi:patatin-like phospholipase